MVNLMMQPTVLNAVIALIMTIGVIVGLSYAARRFGVPQMVRQRSQGGRSASARNMVQIDRIRRLSVVELGGYRFAVLTGGRSDQILRLPAAEPEDMI
ncbi:hypothetical protein [Acidiphilium sp.]|uniref:hypothetical protein n=1 Tax=Acidiphilium sp. TaxID=527 RepID=UPI003D00CFB3